MSAERWREARNVLAVRLDAMGDVVMTAPATRALRHARPGRTVTLLTSPAGAAAAELFPDIDRTIVYSAPWMKATTGAADRAIVDRLAREAFDAAVVFTVYTQSPLPAAMLCHWAGIPLRAAHCRENPYQLLTDWVPESEPHERVRHEVDRQLDLVAGLGCPRLVGPLPVAIPEAVRERVARLLDALDLQPGDPWAVVHVGASAPSRRYPPESFAAAAHELVESGVRLVFTGSEAEGELIEQVRAGMGAYSECLAGQLSLGELTELLRRAPLLISNNTGPVHLACAVGTPVVDLYALTNLQHTPWGVPHRVLNHDVPCRNCFKSVCPHGHNDCLRRVPPHAVARAALELLGIEQAVPAMSWRADHVFANRP